MSFMKRLLLVLHCILSLVALAALVFYEKTQQLVLKANETLGNNTTYFLSIGLIVVFVLLTLGVLGIAFSRKKQGHERGFVTVDSSDGGITRVSVTAIDQMIKQAANTVDGIAEMKVFITPNDDTVDLKANVAIENGSHVPTVTMSLQNAIRKYIEVNCGVAVRKISVNIVAMQNNPDMSSKKKKSDSKTAFVRGKNKELPTQERSTDSYEVSPAVQNDPMPEVTEAQEKVADDLPDLIAPKLELSYTEDRPIDSDESSYSAVQGEAVTDFARRFSHAEDSEVSLEEPETNE